MSGLGAATDGTCACGGFELAMRNHSFLGSDRMRRGWEMLRSYESMNAQSAYVVGVLVKHVNVCARL